MATEVQWRLVSQSGTEFPLPQTMIFLGREECDVTLQSRGVDKRHAVITYDHYEKRFKVKDLNSANGTYVNDTRIPEQSYVKLEHLDNLRFGYDPTVYSIHSCVRTAQQASTDTGMATLESHLPNWTSRDYPVANSVAECEGCLHEQAIQHTCGGTRDPNNVKSSGSFAKSATITTNPFHVDIGSTSPSLTDYCGNMVHLNAGGGMVTFHSGTASTCMTTTSASSSYTHQYSNQPLGNTPFHNVILPTGASGQGLQPAHPSMPSTTYAQPGGTSSGVSASTATTAREGASVAHQHSTGAAIIEGRVQALAVSNLVSAKQKPESTSSNNSLYSAFSGDSLDQLGGETSLVDHSVSDQQGHLRSGTGAKGITEDSKTDSPSGLGKSNKKSVHRAKKESNSSTGHCTQPSTNQSLPAQEVVSQSVLQSTSISPDEQKGKQKGLVTAFTIDFDDTKTPTSKKLDIKDSISKFAPPKAESERPTHRRNHSLGKVETSKEDKGRPETVSPEQSSEKGFYSPKRVSGLRRGYHSEGYFSSDQDEDWSGRNELLSAHKSKRLEKDVMKNGTIVQQTSNDKSNANRKGDCSAVNSSAAFLIDKMFNTTSVKAPPPSPKKNVNVTKKSSEVSVITSVSSICTESRMPSPPPPAIGIVVRPSVLNVNSSFASTTEETVAVIKSNSRNGMHNNNNGNASDEEETKDNVSESGTYTIDKESPSLELQEARRNIDKVFGITPEEPEEAVITGPRGIAQDTVESPESSSSHSKSDSKRGTPTWLREWAATSVARSQHSPSPDRDGSRQSPVTTVSVSHKGMREVINITQGQAPPPSPMSSANGLVTKKYPLGEGQPRPRRKLPTPPVDKPPFSLASSRTSDLSDLDVSGRDRTSSPSISEKLSGRSICVQSPNDNSYDTEKLLRDTENVVSAMEARMDQRSRTFAHGMGSSVESSRDSGGESDVDTSTASYCNESKTHKQDKNVSKRLASQLKSKYQLMDESGHHAPRLSQPAAPSPSASCSRLGSRSRSLTIENDNVANNSDNVSEYETASVASDVSSSSDISGSSPRTRRKNSDKTAPALKFNRAFSLRRARLGYLSDGPSEKPKTTPNASSHPPPVPKGKSVESKRSRPTSSAGTSLSRNDGGRFSLRIAKNAKGGALPPSSKIESSESSAKSKSHLNSSSSVTASRSNSTLSSKEAELKNWRRRKEYDPMKAAAEGRRKDVAKRTNQQRPGRTPTPPSNANNFQRSASFHGTEGLHRFRRNTFTSEDDVARSLEDEEELAISASNSSIHLDSDLPSELSEISLIHVNSQISDVSCRMSSEELPLDEVRPTPIGRPAPTNVSHRHKNKLEALDNLVITTIHQLSSKLCNHTQSVLRRLREQYQGSTEKSQSLEDLMELLGLPDTPTSPSTRTMSRDLSGTLKNLKKLEKCIQVIERVVSADSEIPTDCTVQECTGINGKASIRQKCNGLPDGEYF